MSQEKFLQNEAEKTRPQESAKTTPEAQETSVEEEMSPEQLEDLEIANEYESFLIKTLDELKEELARLELLPDGTDIAERKVAIEEDIADTQEQITLIEEMGGEEFEEIIED